MTLGRLTVVDFNIAYFSNNNWPASTYVIFYGIADIFFTMYDSSSSDEEVMLVAASLTEEEEGNKKRKTSSFEISSHMLSLYC